MGLTVSDTHVSQQAGTGTAANASAALNPKLICDPGVTCGDSEYFYNLNYSGVGPDGLEVCSESEYDMGRFGPISALCAGAPNIYKWAAAGVVCAINGYAAATGETDGEASGTTIDGRKFVATCGAAGVTLYIGAQVFGVER